MLRHIEDCQDSEERQRLLDRALLKDMNRGCYNEDQCDYAQLLIAMGANIDARDESGNTPLILAVAHGQKSGAALLIKKGADISLRNFNGMDALILALNDKLKATTLRLIEGGAPVDRTYGSNETTALIVAVHSGKTGAVKGLLSRHADPLVKDVHGKTALDYAKENNDKTSAEMIEKYITARYEAATTLTTPKFKKIQIRKHGARA